MASAGLSRPTSPDSLSSQNTPDNATLLRTRLEKLAARRNARSMQHTVARAVTIGALLCAPLLLLHRFLIIDLATEIPVAIMVLALLVGIFRGWTKRVGTFEAALDADRVLGLDERLSSALAFAQPDEWKRAQSRSASHQAKSSTRFGVKFRKNAIANTAYVSDPSRTNLVPALVGDAAARVRELEPKKVYPASFDLTTKLLVVSLAALLTFAIMPDLPVFRTVEQQKFAAAMKKQGDELDEIAKPILKQPQLNQNSPTKKLAGKLEALARKMQRGRMGKEEALLGIGQLRRDLEKATKPDANNSQPESSDVQRLREALQSQKMQSAEGQKMQQSLQNNDVKKAAEQLDKLADKMDKGQMTPEEKKQAAQDLKKAAAALKQNGQPDAAKKLEDAAKSLEKQAQQQSQQQQSQGKQGQQSGKNGQNPGQKNPQQNGQKQGSQSQGKNGQRNGKNGSQQSQQGQQGQQQKGGQQGQSQSGQSGQQGQNQGQKSGQSGQSGGQSQQGQQNGQQSGGSQALRDMANQMRQGDGSGGQGGNSQNLQKMLDKIKEAERNAGGNSGQGQGQSQGGSSQQGENSGQSVTPGKDLKPSDPRGAVGGGAGLGPRNHAGGSQSGGGVSKLKSKRTGDKRRWQDVWTDRLPKTRQKIDRITGKLGDSGEMQQLPTKTEAKGGTATTPYYNVYESYKKDAEDAVAKDNVPPAYKQPVKNYFESLKP